MRVARKRKNQAARIRALATLSITASGLLRSIGEHSQAFRLRQGMHRINYSHLTIYLSGTVYSATRPKENQ